MGHYSARHHRCQNNGRVAGDPRNEQADRAGYFESAGQLAKPLSGTDRAEGLHHYRVAQEFGYTHSNQE